jgi:hypothetical protein
LPSASYVHRDPADGIACRCVSRPASGTGRAWDRLRRHWWLRGRRLRAPDYSREVLAGCPSLSPIRSICCATRSP